MNDELTRVDIEVMSVRKDLTRTAIKNLIVNGIITVNNEQVMPNYKIHGDDVINIDDKKIAAYLEDSHTLYEIKERNLKLKALYEDEYAVAIDKPEGINSHPVLKNDTNSILNGIYFHVHRQQKFTRDVKIRLVHRLDKETSGVLLAAKDSKAHEFYSKRFEHRDAKKTYFAIVHGDFLRYLERKEKQFETISTYIGEHEPTKKYINTDPRKGKYARTVVYFDKHFNKFGKKKFSLVRVEPETGRTHQIRVHLAGIGFPILGDKLYGGQKYKRIMLHAFSLIVPRYPDGELLRIISPLPEKFEESNPLPLNKSDVDVY